MPDSIRCEELQQTVATPNAGASIANSLFLESRSRAYRALIERLERLASLDEDLVLTGPTGVGKTVLGMYVHERSARADGPLVVLDVGAISPELAASTLFGHRRGAFTGATESRTGAFVAASGGTLILDEIGKADLTVQRTLLGAIETRRFNIVGDHRPTVVNTRIIATSNEPIQQLIAAGEFLDDFDARLGHFRTRVPPLKERAEDIPGLVRAWVQRLASKYGYVLPPAICSSLLRRLVALTWPRNMRQLIGAVNQLLFGAQGAATLDETHIDDALRDYLADTQLRTTIARAPDRAQIEQALRENDDNRTVTALHLGISRHQLNREIRKHGLPRKRE